ncbi:MAG: GerMN domain-containing protein [Niallia sp.]
MGKQKWNEEKIKHVLKQLPSIKDERSPESIYHTIQLKKKPVRKMRRIMPVLATACTIMLLFIISQSFFDSNESFKSERKVAENSSIMKAKISDEAEKNEMQNLDIAEEQKDMSATSLTPIAIYQEDIGNQEVLTYPIPDVNVQVIVPISILVENPDHLSRFDLYVQNVKKVIGINDHLSDYFPISPEIFTYTLKDNNIEVDVKREFTNFGSHSEEFFNTMIQQQLQSIGAKKMEFYTNDKLGAELGNRTETTIDYRPLENRAYFLLQDGESKERPLYVPWEEPYDSIENAFDAMEDNIETHGLMASIPDTIDIDKVSKDENKRQLIVYLSNDSKMEEDQKTLYAIESILLTAKEFKYSTVKFENTKVKEVGDFLLTKELVVPVAANRVDIKE